MIYNIEALLEAENDGLKGAKARDEHIDSLRQGYAASGAQARTFFTTPIPRGGKILEKSWSRHAWVFLSGHPGAFLNLPKNRQIREHSSPRKIPTHHAKLKFCR